MSRMVCVDVARLPLQLLLRRQPEWRAHPVAVIDRDAPQGRLLWVNERARRARILPGMRYAAALSLAGGLRAGEVPASEIEHAVEATVRRLSHFSPSVEAAADEPGVFWLDASGLEPLYVSVLEWARCVAAALRDGEQLESSIVVGFTSFATYAVARASTGITVFTRLSEEQIAVRRVSLARLEVDPAARDLLFKLGVHTVGDLADLPPEGVRKRLGKELGRLHQLARGEIRMPLSSRTPEQPLQRELHLDHGEASLERLVVYCGELLDALLAEAATRHVALAALTLELGFEGGQRHRETVQPATPTRDAKQLIELLTLRLDTLELPDLVTDLALGATAKRTTERQLDLFAARPARDLEAAARALARLRAEFGDAAVVRARLREGHLPEALFRWEPLERVEMPRPHGVERGTVVRRIVTRPLPLPARPRHEPDGWMLRGLEQGPVVRVAGPFLLSGGWWQRAVQREYHFAETQRGEILWVYYDRARRRWFIQGRLE